MENAAFVRIIAGLALVLGAILLSAWLARRFGLAGSIGRNPAPLRLQSTLSLGPRHKIAVVQVEQQRLLIGISPQGITLLHTLAPDELLPEDATTSDDTPHVNPRVSTFSSLLAQWLPGAASSHSRKP